jgi:hypothetical protein
MDSKLQFPGLSNTWTMPVENRLDMELTGIKTPLGLKIQGPNLEGIQQVGAQVQQILSAIPEMRSIFAERVSQAFYLNIEVNRAEAGSLWSDYRRRAASGHFGNRRRNGSRECRGPRAVSRECPVQPRLQGQRRGIAARPDWHARGRADSSLRCRETLVLLRTLHDPRLRRGADWLRVHRSKHERLRRLRHQSEQFAQAKTRPTSRFHLQMVR